jgi:hypothetical protein
VGVAGKRGDHAADPAGDVPAEPAVTENGLFLLVVDGGLCKDPSMKASFIALAIIFSMYRMPALAQVSSDASAVTATIYVYRLKEFYGEALKPSVYLDKVDIGRMRNGRYMRKLVAPGSHTVTSTFKGSGAVVDMKPGEVHYFRVRLSNDSEWHGAHGQLVEVLPDEGKFEVAQLKPSEDKDLK